METEIWKDIDGFNGKYQVSNFGRVKSNKFRCINKEFILKQNFYLKLKLWKLLSI